MPGLQRMRLASSQWRTTTGSVNRNPPTGFDQNAVQV
jgi:hypothetical protein